MRPSDTESHDEVSRTPDHDGSLREKIEARLPLVSFGLLVFDAEGRLQSAGGSNAVGLFGDRSPMSLVGTRASELFQKAPEVLELFDEVAKENSRGVMLRRVGKRLVVRGVRLNEGVALILLPLGGSAFVELAATGFDLFLERSPATVWLTDDRLRILQASGSLLARMGLSREKIRGMSVKEVFHARDPSRPIVAYHLAALAGESGRVRLNHDRRWYDVMIAPVRDSLGRVEGCSGLAIDVTRQVRRERRLKDSSRRLAEAQRLAHVGSWHWCARTDRFEWSDEMMRIFGQASEEQVRSLDDIFARVHRDDREMLQRKLVHALRAGESFDCEHRIVRKGGDVRMLHTTCVPERDANGKTTRLVGSSADITEQWKTRSELQASLSLLEATLESTADGVLVVDRQGRAVRWNERFRTLWEIPLDVLVNCDDAALRQAATGKLEDSDAFNERVNDLYSQRELEGHDIVRFLDGRVVEMYSRPYRLGGEVVGRVWNFRDVTDRERFLERALLLAEAGRLLASMDVESAAESVARLLLPHLGDAAALDLYREADGPRRLFSLSTGDRTARLEVPRAALGGHKMLFDVNGRSCLAAPLVSRNSLLGVLVVRASSDRTFTREDLDFAMEIARRIALAFENARLYRQAKEATEARDEFLAVAAHEIRGPVASLGLALEGLRSGRVSEKRSQAMFDLAARQVKTLSRLINELLDVSRVRSGALFLELEEFDLANVVREVVSRMTSELSRTGSQITVDAQAGVRGQWDRLRVEQLVSNLVGNAIKFGRDKPIEVSVTAEDGQAVIAVRDHGVGIAENTLPQVFEPFERGESARNLGGLGLGLYISHSIVEALGGQFEVRSTLGHGATFKATLPLGNAT